MATTNALRLRVNIYKSDEEVGWYSLLFGLKNFHFMDCTDILVSFVYSIVMHGQLVWLKELSKNFFSPSHHFYVLYPPPPPGQKDISDEISEEATTAAVLIFLSHTRIWS